MAGQDTLQIGVDTSLHLDRVCHRVCYGVHCGERCDHGLFRRDIRSAFQCCSPPSNQWPPKPPRGYFPRLIVLRDGEHDRDIVKLQDANLLGPLEIESCHLSEQGAGWLQDPVVMHLLTRRHNSETQDKLFEIGAYDEASVVTVMLAAERLQCSSNMQRNKK
jgi:hypothetical protein